MELNIFEKITPRIEDFPQRIYLQGLFDSEDGFKIILEDKESPRSFTATFEKHILGYRNFDESDRFKKTNIYPCSTADWALFKSDNTEFINWLNSETFTPYAWNEIIHIAVVTSTHILEIIAFDEPVIVEIFHS